MLDAGAGVGSGLREKAMAKVHPTAIVDPAAELADTVEVGPHAVVESDVKIGEGTVLRSHAVVRRYTTLGGGNLVDSFAVLGGPPQDYNFTPETVSYLRIGDNNVFREGVTINRATGAGNATTVGNGTYWMAQSHAGHNVTVEDEVVLVNSAVLGGYARVGYKALLSSHVGVHQFTWVGRMAIGQGNAGTSCHVPPYCIFAEGINRVVGLNAVGLRRAEHISAEDRRQIKEAFRITYRSGLSLRGALAQMEACGDWGEAAGLFRDFIREVIGAEGPFARRLCKFYRRSKGHWRPAGQ